MPFFLGSRQRRSGESTRDRLVALIHTRPGVHKSALCDATGLAWGTVDYHLRLLERAGRIGTRHDGRETRCFPTGLSPARQALFASVSSQSASRIAFALRHAPGQGVSALSRRLSLSERVVRRHVFRMVAEGLLERQGKHRPVYRWPADMDDLLQALPSPEPLPEMAPLLREPGLSR